MIQHFIFPLALNKSYTQSSSLLTPENNGNSTSDVSKKEKNSPKKPDVTQPPFEGLHGGGHAENSINYQRKMS